MKRIWFNMALHKGRIEMSPLDRGLALGDGLFETLAVNGDVALWRFEHVERLKKAADELGIPFPETEIENAIDALIHRLRGHQVMRLTLTGGEGGRGLAAAGKKPQLIGTLMPFDASLRFMPMTLVTSSVRRNLHAPSSRMKTLSYIDNIVAAREAVTRHVDDALMLNTAGRVACTTIGNLFVEKNGVLHTPAMSEGILPGVMRDAVVRVAKQSGIVVKEKLMKPGEVQNADALFVTNSLRFLRPVTKLDGVNYATRSELLAIIMLSLLKTEQEQLILN